MTNTFAAADDDDDWDAGRADDDEPVLEKEAGVAVCEAASKHLRHHNHRFRL